MAEVMPIPPLLGDDNGKYRVMLVGNSGKTLHAVNCAMWLKP